MGLTPEQITTIESSMAIASIAIAPIKTPVVLQAVVAHIVPSVDFVSKAVVAVATAMVIVSRAYVLIVVVVPDAWFAIVAIVPTAIHLFADSMRHIRLGVGVTG